MQLTQEQITSLKRVQWITTPPCIMPASEAFRVSIFESKARFYVMHWWHDNLAGMTRFIFADNREGQSELSIFTMNRFDTAMDVSKVISAQEAVQVRGLIDCTQIKDCIQLTKIYKPLSK